MTFAARLESKIQRIPESGCWVWMGALQSDGYGSTWANGKPALAHRASYEAHKGSIPEGAELDHLCRVRACVNPTHLEPVPHRVNCRRGLAAERGINHKTKKTACPQGHAYTSASTYVRANGHRQCRTCDRAYHARKRLTQGH